MRRFQLLMALAAAASAVVSACEEAAPVSPLQSSLAEIECEYNSDCAKGLICAPLTGRCQQCVNEVVGIGMIANNQCGSGETCSPDGECVSACRDDEDCQQGFCFQGTCVDEAGSSTTQSADDVRERWRDALEEAGWIDEDGDFVPPEDVPTSIDDLPGPPGLPGGFPGVGTTKLKCPDEFDTVCAEYICTVCSCWGIDSYQCLDAAAKDDEDFCEIKLDQFVCDTSGRDNPFGGFGGEDIPFP